MLGDIVRRVRARGWKTGGGPSGRLVLAVFEVKIGAGFILVCGPLEDELAGHASRASGIVRFLLVRGTNTK